MKEIVFGDNNLSANNDITGEKIEFLQLRSLTLEHLETLDNFASDYLTHLRSKEKYQGVEPYASTTPFFNAQVEFPNLDTLKLSSLLNLNQIWDDNYQSMCNLTSLIVDNCVGLKYLFSSTLVESFMNLKQLEISNCPMMEEIIAKEDRNNAVKEVNFLKLEKIILKDMDSLKTIWHHQFETSKMLEVNNCKKIVVVFPSSMQNTYNELEKLEVTNCDLVEEIFKLNFNENNSEEVMTHLKEVTLGRLSKLKKIWSEDPQGILSFQNLINVELKLCPSLEYLLPVSVATRCSHLKELWIRECDNMKEIVAEENESSMNEDPVFEFNQLSTLLLWHSPKLNGFYAGNHTLLCPSLRNINVSTCTKLKLFRSSNFQDEKHSVLMQQPLFIAEEVIPNLELLRMQQPDADMILQTQNSSVLFSKMTFIGLTGYNTEDARFPYWFLENVHTLESLFVEWSCFKKIFQDKGEIREKTHPHIKSLTLNELHKLQHICEEGSQIDPVLEFLEYLEVLSCPSLTNLMPSSVTLNHLTKLEVIKCNGLKHLITTPTARSLDKLTVLKIKDCNSLEEVVNGVENVDIAFMSLQILMLECLPSLIKFCSSQCFMKFPLLQKVIVGECPRMNIFSAGNTSTPILRKVKIAENDSEWQWKGNLNDTIYNMFEDKVGFGSFKYLKLSEYPELKELWYGRLENNAFRSLKHLVVHKCDFLSDVLFQPNLLEVLMNLEELDVEDCNSLEAVFDLKDEFAKEIVVQNSTQLKKLKLSNLPKLKHVWKEDPHYTMRFENLSDVSVVGCKSLISLFPLPVARDMMQLQNLRVSNCGIEEIVAKEEGTDEMVKFVFPHLTFIKLDNLTKLKAFFVGIHSLQCKSLKTIRLSDCPKIELFKAEPLRHQERSRNNELNISTYQPLFVIEEEVLTSVESTPQFSPGLRELNLWELPKLKYICKEGFQMDPFLHFLERIHVYQCSNLIKLVPSSVTFSYMTSLEVTNCNGLKNLITHSTAKSLVKLTTMKIEMCNWLEDIVNGKEDETNEIVFCSLQTLELISLQRLCRFCSCPCPIKFPLLEVVVVKVCPRMELFSLGVTNTTNLQNVQTDEENYWEGDLNRTIKKMFYDKVAFGKFKYLALSDYPELKDVRYGQLHCNVFCNLKHLVVERCDFLSHVLFPSNVMQVLQTLEELEVKDCDSLEAVFDVKGLKSQEILIKEIMKLLKRMTLSSLPKLKHIWNEDPHEIISFGNLHKVDVSMCQSLLYIFPYSLCPDLGHLEMLEISSCGIKEIVAMEETVSMEIQFNFPQLKVMVLGRLSNLKSFYQGKHTLDCPLLKTFNVYCCEALRMFSFSNSDFQQPYSVDENQAMLFQQPMFCIEKLSPNLEELAVNSADMLGILNGYRQENIFHKVEFLRLQCFDETPTVFLNDFHTIFPKLQTFQVRNSSFEILFPTKGTTDHLNMQIRKVFLFELEKLEHIWQEDFPLDHPLLQHLEIISVMNCPSLISLVPSSTSFTNLTYLVMDNCKELVYLITSSTAKSLVQLKALKLKNCEKMLDVVKIDEEKAEENIVFENLEWLEFTSLSCLRSFCYGKQTFIFPSLLFFIVKGCPQMKIFSSGFTMTPYLTGIKVEENNMLLKGDLNTTIEQLFIDKEVPHSN